MRLLDESKVKQFFFVRVLEKLTKKLSICFSQHYITEETRSPNTYMKVQSLSCIFIFHYVSIV